MVSDVIHVTGSNEDLERALELVEHVAAYEDDLSQKEALHLRLLTEEMMGMLAAITKEDSADFWIEKEENTYSLHLGTDTLMNAEKRQELLDVSTSGNNSAVKGVMGKIGDLFVRAFEPLDDNLPDAYTEGWIYDDFNAMGSPMMLPVWSLNQYKDSLGENGQDEAWDELEKSIVAKLADEVKIYIKGTRVEMVIFKTFE